MLPSMVGVIGYPITHSWSPALFNYVLDRSGIEALYIAVSLEPSALSRFVQHSRQSFSGYNVTIPHKISILQHLDSLDETADFTGAVNLVVNENGTLKGYNSDVSGFLKMVEAENVDFNHKNVGIVGSGGVSRAVLHSIQSRFNPSSIAVIARTPEKFAGFFKSLGIAVVPINDITEKPEILINCTPIGMAHHSENGTLPERLLIGAETFVDLVYNPQTTRSMQVVRKNGGRAISGAKMFLYQAEESYRRIFGLPPPHNLFQKALNLLAVNGD